MQRPSGASTLYVLEDDMMIQTSLQSRETIKVSTRGRAQGRETHSTVTTGFTSKVLAYSQWTTAMPRVCIMTEFGDVSATINSREISVGGTIPASAGGGGFEIDITSKPEFWSIHLEHRAGEHAFRWNRYSHSLDRNHLSCLNWGKTLQGPRARRGVTNLHHVTTLDEGCWKTSIVESLEELKQKGYTTRVVVVDGGSSDNIAEIAVELGCKIFQQWGDGKGVGTKGFKKFLETGDDVFLMLDCDGTYHPEESQKWLNQYQKAA